MGVVGASAAASRRTWYPKEAAWSAMLSGAFQFDRLDCAVSAKRQGGKAKPLGWYFSSVTCERYFHTLPGEDFDNQGHTLATA